MTYQNLAHFAQTGGLLYFVALFGLAIWYALRPANRSRFDKAARSPISED